MTTINEDTLMILAKYEGRLHLTSCNAEECYAMFKKLTDAHLEELVQNVTNIHMPSCNLSDNSKSILASISKFYKLTSFTFTGGKRNAEVIKGHISNLPCDMFNLKNLVYLNLNFNVMKEIAEWIFSMELLQTLQLSYCDIIQISSGISRLCNLRELYMNGNLLETLPEEFSFLVHLVKINLSNNKFADIPSALKELSNLQFLDLSQNMITGHLSQVIEWKHLETLKLRSNKISTIDDSFEGMACLKVLDLRINRIRCVSREVESKQFILLDGNPLGYESPKKESEKEDGIYDVPVHYMGYDVSCLKIDNSTGGQYVLPSGIKISVPKDALDADTTLYSHIIADPDVKFTLHDMDQLLSSILEMTPHGQNFKQPLRISLPYRFERNDQQIREVVVRVMSADGVIEDLITTTTVVDDNLVSVGVAEASTHHFSLFGVVARVVESSAVIEKEHPHLLFSPVYPQTKLQFPIDSVDSETKVTMKIINVDQTIVEEVSDSSSAATSCVLSVSVHPRNTIFKQPVTVKLALPDPLLGKQFKHSQLRLYKCIHGSHDWIDVTSDVNMQISSVDAMFKVRSFSKFILVTEIICGVVRTIYRRLRTHKVQFIAMQKRSLPSQVLAQCVVEKKVACRIDQLNKSGYIGEDAVTQIQDMVEGDIYKIKVIGDLKIQTYNEKLAQHIKQKVVVCKFFSQYPPDKMGFSRMEKVESTVPEASAAPKVKISTPIAHEKRRISEKNDHSHGEGQNVLQESSTVCSDDEIDDDNHLGDVPIALENFDLKTLSNPDKMMELDFGGLGTGMFRDENLRVLAYHIGDEWREIGTFLDIPYAHLDRIASDHPGKTLEQIFKMLRFWANLHKDDEDCIDKFTKGLSLAGRNDLVIKVKSLYEDGKREFRESVKRKKGIQVPSDWIT